MQRTTIGRAIAAVFLTGLSGCNAVVSVEPWFTEEDTQGTPGFRDGLWMSAQANCEVDVAEPAERWPDCAQAGVIRDREWLEVNWDLMPTGERVFAGWRSERIIIANGTPLIAQVPLNGEGTASSSEEGERDEPQWRYAYGAVRPKKLDQQGKIIAYDQWTIVCGPLPESKVVGQTEDGPILDQVYVTDQPFPGLAIIDNSCVAESIDALRSAGVLSEPLGEHGEARWVRDGWR
jgi:hypothetical protein